MTVEQLTLTEAWKRLADDPQSVLIDVRTAAEWNFVGVPDLASLEKPVRTVEWITYPGGSPNPDFVAEASADLDPNQPILLICRSGGRSQAAAEALEQAGFTTANVSAGFEGDLDGEGHRSGGWRTSGLPWRQQ